MINELLKKEVQTVKAMMDAYKDSIDNAQKELDVIDEKYKKIIAEEKKSLKEQLSVSKTQLKVWEKMFNNFDSTLVQEVLGEFNSTATEEDEGTVFDSVFPENNTDEEEEEKEDEKELVPVLAEKKDPDAEEDAEWDEKIESGEIKKMTQKDIVNSLEAAGFVNVEKKEVPVLEDGEDGWPEFPEDWKN